MISANPVNPQRVTWELSPRLPERAIITSDSGSCANWYARDLKIRRGMMCSLSGGLASMGAAVPYAIAAKFAHPDRPVIALGRRRRDADEQHGRADHRRQILAGVGKPELDLLRLQQRGSEPGHLGAAGDGRRPEIRRLAAAFPNVPYHKFAELIGLKGIFVDDPERSARAWDEALASDRPVVLEVKTDPEVPPLPPHITPEAGQELHGDHDQGRPKRRSHAGRHGPAGARKHPAWP